MGANWPIKRIEELRAENDGSIAIGPFGSRMKSDCYVKKGIPVIRGTNISGSPKFSGDFVYIDEKLANKLGSSNVYKNDLVFPHRGSIGEVGIISDDGRYVISSSLMKLSCNLDLVLPRYLYYFFKSDLGRHQLLKNASQVGTPGIGQPLTSLKSIAVQLPPLAIQNKIIEVLWSLDMKIELNNQLNQTLESMAQALFKSWFVDFDPVIDNAIAADNPIPEPFQARAERRRQRLHEPVAEGQSPLQPLPAELRQLFPNSFQETELLGWVPEGWGVVSVSEAIEVNPRVSLKMGVTAKYADMKVLPTSGYYISEIVEKEYAGGAKFIQGDVLLARITPCLENGKTAIVDFLNSEEVGFGSTEFIVLRGRGSLKTSFIACLARLQAFRDHCIQNMVGSSGRQRVQNSCFTSFHLALPMQGAVTKLFDEKAKDFFEKSSLNSRQNCSLSSLRDALLPKLLSGQLRIPDAEAQLAEAGL